MRTLCSFVPKYICADVSEDSIKRAARRQAWYAQNGEDERTYNFFGRMSNPRRVRDEENRVYGGHVLAATVTENDLRTQREERRRIQWHSSEEAVGGEPKRAGSFSAAPSGRLPLVCLKKEWQLNVSTPTDTLAEVGVGSRS